MSPSGPVRLIAAASPLNPSVAQPTNTNNTSMYAPFIGSPSSTASVGFLQFVFARAFPLKDQWWYPVVDEQHPVNPPSSYPISRQRSFNEQYISTAYE